MSTADSTHEDLRYVRRLAESGAHAPLLGGRFMAWWGLLLTAAYVAHHFALAGAIGDGHTVFLLIWGAFGILGLGGQLLLARTMSGKAGAGSAGNRASRVAWCTAGMAIASMVGGATAAATRGAGPGAFDWIVPVAFAVYACALLVTGSLARSLVTMVAGAGAIAMVGLFAALVLSPERYLLAAGGVALTVLLPGLLLVKAEPR
ncbi:MAG TPA: hypothetical protein VFQ67_09030 [Allosphingosinicella sp.]|jgi:hypothetical protein|nr:hypothetical protein [Allosphingosinicella sp.]